MIVNPSITLVGALQFFGGLYSFYTGNWRLGVINCLVGVANAVLSTLKG